MTILRCKNTHFAQNPESVFCRCYAIRWKGWCKLASEIQDEIAAGRLKMPNKTALKLVLGALQQVE